MFTNEAELEGEGTGEWLKRDSLIFPEGISALNPTERET